MHTYDSIGDDGLVPNLSHNMPVRLSVSLDFMTSAGTDSHRCSLPAFYKALAKITSYYQHKVVIFYVAYCSIDEMSAFNADIKTFYRKNVNTCIKATALAIPSTNNYQIRRRLLGWYEMCSTMRKSSLLWHSIWVNAG